MINRIKNIVKNRKIDFFFVSHYVHITPQITGGKKQSDEGAALFAVRVNLPCYVRISINYSTRFNFTSTFPPSLLKPPDGSTLISL
jgi:hypothetical protein